MQHDALPRTAPQADITHTDEIHAGLMSGTSMDGVDGVLIGRIRRKLGVSMIRTVRGRGFVLAAPEGDEAEGDDDDVSVDPAP